MERETGIEPAPSAWKAEVLPLNYSRADQLALTSPAWVPHPPGGKSAGGVTGGGRWIRTTEGVSQQIYSLPHLATLVLALS